MFTAFMLALTFTSVANVLVIMAAGPLFTAVIARVFIGQRLPGRTWAAIVTAGAGIVYMYGSQMWSAFTDPAANASGLVLGSLASLCVPVGWRDQLDRCAAQPAARGVHRPRAVGAGWAR